MTLASVKVIETYVVECPDHPELAFSTNNRPYADETARYHNNTFHTEPETLA